MNLLFVRHGQASFGQENYDKLSKLGERQARTLGRAYATAGRDIDVIVTGTLQRQQESAKLFLAEYATASASTSLSKPSPPTHCIAGFNEFLHEDVLIQSNPAFAKRDAVLNLIAQHDKPKVKLAELFQTAMTRWHAGDNDADYKESWTAFNTRVWQAVHELQQFANKQAANTVMVFTSGGVIACIAAQILSGKPNSQLAYQLNRSMINTGVSTVSVNSDTDNMSLISLNEHSHLYKLKEKLVTWY